MKFKIGDRVYVKCYDDTGTIINIYEGHDNIGYNIAIDPDNPKKHIPLTSKDFPTGNIDPESVTLHVRESDCELIGVVKKNPQWAKIWEDQ